MKTYKLPSPRVLVIDDNQASHDEFRKIFADAAQTAGTKSSRAANIRVDYAKHGQDALALVAASKKVNDPYAVAFVALQMSSGWGGLAILEQLWQASPELHAVICTGTAGGSWPEIFNRLSSPDQALILNQPFDSAAVLQMVHALTAHWSRARQLQTRLDMLEQMADDRGHELEHEVEQRQCAEDTQRSADERFTTAFESSPVPMAIQSWPEGRFLAVNEPFAKLTGLGAWQLVDNTSQELHLWADEGALKARLNSSPKLRQFPCMLHRCDGAMRNVIVSAGRLTYGTQQCVLLVAEDVTDRVKLETGLRQTQKLEVVGRLVASAAHEFNNVLAEIQGHASMLQSQLDDQQQQEKIAHILRASQRAARFTRQLLGIGRQQPTHFTPVSLATGVERVNQLLEHTLGGTHQIKTMIADNLPLLRADEFNAEQLLINLILNSRDAMPEGGEITVAASSVKLTSAYAQAHEGARAGTFVCLAVSDHGCGIPDEIIDQIFEPFFTTKEADKGTGLGLWMVHNIVRQHRGWIELVSEVDRGTTFKVFFPVWGAAGPEESAADSEPVEASAGLLNGAHQPASHAKIQTEMAHV